MEAAGRECRLMKSPAEMDLAVFGFCCKPLYRALKWCAHSDFSGNMNVASTVAAAVLLYYVNHGGI